VTDLVVVECDGCGLDCFAPRDKADDGTIIIWCNVCLEFLNCEESDDDDHSG
jgi:hypothetical protein